MTTDSSKATASLVPCPFCGTNEHLHVAHCGSAVSGYYPRQVRCAHIDCDEVRGPVGNGEYEATAAWNRRAALRLASGEEQ